MLLSTYFGGLILVAFCSVMIFIPGKERLRSIIGYLVSLFVILICFWAGAKFNYAPIVGPINDTKWHSYIFSIGAQGEIKTLNAPISEKEKGREEQESSFKILPYLNKLKMLISSQEVPDNINYCFVRDGIFPLKYMIPPFLLYSLAIPGLLLFLLLSGSIRAKLSIVGVVISIALPTIIFVPLSRYTVFISPVLCAFATWLMVYVALSLYRKERKKILIAVLFILAGFLVQKLLNKGDIYRASDFIAYANILEMQNPNDSRILYAYEQAYLILEDKQSDLGKKLESKIKGGI